MLLRDLLEVPELRLRLLVGEPDELNRPVRWIYPTDLPDPARYLSGGELVISGMVWRHDPADTERFVAAIAGAGAAALAAGEALFPEVPADVVAACRRHGLVLLAVPEEVSFAAVTEHVVGQLTAARSDRLAARLGRQRQLLSAVAAGMALTELTEQVSDAVGLLCRVFTPTGRAIAAGATPLAEADVDRLVHTYLTATGLPAEVPGSPGYSVFPVGPALHRLTSWFVAVTGSWTVWTPEVVDAVAELAEFAALDRSRRAEARRLGRDIADDTVRLAGAGLGGQETTLRLRQAGLDPGAELTVAVASPRDQAEPADTAALLLDDALTSLGPSVVGMAEDGTAVALLASAPGAASPGNDVSAALRVALGRLGPALRPGGLVVGVSRPTDAQALAGAVREARHALALARLRDGPVQVVCDSEFTSHVALLASVPDDLRRAFASRVLDAVLDYDARNDAGLLDTLTAYLECSGSWSRVAQRLHLHVNTVRYRIGRVEQLTGRDLSSLADRVDLFLALRSR
jgi:DNA-binding PucR family transcriptional regulator